MVPVHVAHQKIENRHVHEIIQSPSLIVRWNFSDQRAVIRLRLPLSFPPLVIRSPPRVSPYLKTTRRVNQSSRLQMRQPHQYDLLWLGS